MVEVYVHQIRQTFEDETVEKIYHNLVGKRGEVVYYDPNGLCEVNINGDTFWLMPNELRCTKKTDR